MDAFPSAIQGLRFIFDRGIDLKYQTLNIIASCLKILTWVVVVVGVVMSVRLGIIATTLTAAVTFLLGGFVLTAICASILLAASKFIYLFIDLEGELSEIARLLKKENKD